MGEELLDFGLVKDQMQGIIKVVGIGGGGCNAVRNMYNEGVEGVTYAVCNTDSQSLSRSPVPVKIQLGSGLGAGGNPEHGREEAQTSINDFVKLFSDGTKMVFVTAGMGGGTGTGAAPVVAGVAKDSGILLHRHRLAYRCPCASRHQRHLSDLSSQGRGLPYRH